MTHTTPRGLAPKQAATYIGVSEQTLRKQRHTGSSQSGMPLVPYLRAGRRIIYLVEDLDRWLEEQRVVPKAPREGRNHVQ